MTGVAPGPADRAAELLATRAAFGRVEAAILARTPEHDVAPSLERIAGLMDLLGSPQHAFPVVHVTGTNGKTSTTRMIEALLRAHGLNTGLFTSPHLHSITERIALNAAPVGLDRFVAGYEEIHPYIELLDARSAGSGGSRMSYFEVVTALAYAIFADAPVDVAAVEVGMGGAWDATNVADGQVAVLTPIGVDHERFLGADPVAIATEKVGIIKADAIAVSAGQEPEVVEVIAEAAERVGARLVLEGRDIGVVGREPGVGGQLLTLHGLAGDYPDIVLPLLGAYQAGNALMALTAVEAFLGGGRSGLDHDLVRAAFADVSSPGRLEVVRRSPTVLVDAAHNPAGAAALAAALTESFPFLRVIGVVAILADKDVAGILEQLEPVLAHVVVSRSTSPRSLDPARLGSLAADVFGDDRVSVVADLPDALDRAAELADADSRSGGVGGIVVATGSVTTAADVRMLLGQTAPTRDLGGPS